jgi:hypothetical protein
MAERAQIVEPGHMVEVGVSEQHAINALQVGGQGLGAKVGARVDQQRLGAGAEQGRCAGTAIAGVGGGADGAVAADHRDAHRGAGAKKA